MLTIGSNIRDDRTDGSLNTLRHDLNAFLAWGLGAAEIPVHGLSAIRNGRCDDRRIEQIASILSEYPFAYSTHAPSPLNLMDPHDPDLHRDVLYAALEFTAAIGAAVMVYHPGRFLAEEAFGIWGPRSFSPDEKNDLIESEAHILSQAALDFPDVIIAMKNARPYLLYSLYCYAEIPGDLVSQIERIGRPNVRMAMDFGHLHLAACFFGLDGMGEVQGAARHIAYCHVHDTFGRSVYDSGKRGTHQIPLGRGGSPMPGGWCDNPFERLFISFIDAYQGILICDMRGRHKDGMKESAWGLPPLSGDDLRRQRCQGPVA